jgi:hypothetical protein
MGKPDIFNTDQGSQFTSNLFTSELLNRDIRVSMDGRGRVLNCLLSIIIPLSVQDFGLDNYANRNFDFSSYPALKTLDVVNRARSEY